jgi:hypothetical protein
MPRKPSDPPKVFEATVFVIGKKLPSGNTYPQELADKIIMNVVTGEQKYTIEEVAPADREKNGIKPYESWKKRAMAVCVDARLEGNRLIMSFQIYKNKYGKSLELILQNNPPGNVEFYPVGVGNVDENGVVSDYQLSYISLDVKLPRINA